MKDSFSYRAKFCIVALALYGVGCGVSQSLMSLGSTLFIVGVLSLLIPEWRNLKFSRLEKSALALVLAWELFTLIRLLGFVEAIENKQHALSMIPLFSIPILAYVAQVKFKIFKEKDIYWICGCWALALVVSCGQAFSQAYARPYLPSLGFFKNSIFFAYNLLPAIVVLGEWILLGKRVSRLSKIIASVVLSLVFVALFMSASRTALASALVYFGGLFLPRVVLRQPKMWIPSLLSVLLLAGVFAHVYKTNNSFRYKVNWLNKLEQDESWRLRLFIWKENFKTFEAHPLVGVGIEQNGLSESSNPDFKKTWDGSYLIFAHSIYLQILAESGIIGSILVLLCIATLWLLAPTTWPIAVVGAFAGLTENIYNNSKQLHPFLLGTAVLIIYKCFSGRKTSAKALKE